MSERTTYEIVLRGRPSARLLRPLLDDFNIDTSIESATRLVGSISDAAHLHGLLVHLTSVNLHIVSITSITKGNTMTTTQQAASHSPTQTATNQRGAMADNATPAMQAITQDRYGSADVLELATVARPTPKPDEVLIQVVAAAVDRGTCHLMTGTPYLIRIAGYGLRKPKNKIVGLDVSGRVVSVGADVTRFEVGDEVFGIANGSLAEFTTAAETKLAHKPATVSFEHAAASAVSGITALQALTDVGRLESGQSVLIVGASGGVGSFTVQLAKALGANVSAVASARNRDLVRSLGADQVIDYTTEDFAASGERYDLIIDIGGRNSVSRLRSVLDRNGTLVIVGGEDGNKITGGIGRQLWALMLSPFTSHRLTTFISKEHFSFMERLADHIESGAVTPAVQATFDLGDAAKAIDLLDTGKASGKNVIVIAPTH